MSIKHRKEHKKTKRGKTILCRKCRRRLETFLNTLITTIEKSKNRRVSGPRGISNELNKNRINELYGIIIHK